MWKTPFPTFGGNVHLCYHYGKQYEVPFKTENRTAIWSRDSTSWFLIQRK